MGLFDELLKDAVGGEAREPEQQSRGLVEGLLEMLQQPDGDGVDGLARSFERKGLGAEAPRGSAPARTGRSRRTR